MSSEKPKKGLFSWLGFGKAKTETPPADVDSTTADTVAAVEPEISPLATESQLEPDTQIRSDAPPEAVIETAPTVPGVAKAPVLSDARDSEAALESRPAPIIASEPETAVASPEFAKNAPPAAPQVQAASSAPAEPERTLSASVESSVIDAGRDKPRSWFARLKEGLKRTRSQFGDGMAALFLGRKTIDQELFDELETQLVMADVGLDTTSRLLAELTQEVSRKELKDASILLQSLKNRLKAILQPVSQPLQIDPVHRPYLILVVGVNGAGKTTTIGKLAKHLQQQGKSVMLAAGDTFRAAAVEQLQVWGERNAIPVVAQHTGADSASVVFDALQSAKARQIDVLIADTAGRLHNKAHLMEELKKVVRVIGKQDPSAPHEVMLVLDATIGQNAISQAEHFVSSVGVNSLALTKLDGTAKGGILFALADRFKLPIRFIGVGERLEDLRPFNGDEFVEALFDNNPDAG